MSLDEARRKVRALGVAPMPAELAPSFPNPKPASELKVGDESGDWFWHGYFARHTTTLLSSLWKVGKTTLIAHLLKSLETGSPFCGRAVRPTRVLYVGEEHEAMWARRRDKLGIADHVHFQLRPFRARPTLAEWLGFLRHLRAQIDRHDFGVVLFDPLTTLWPVEKENEAAAVADALMPLSILTEKAAVVLSHHFRKSDGAEATGSRGSGALPGYVDTILELRRFAPSEREDRRRVLSGYGRFEETPAELVIELTGDGYIAHGNKQEVRNRGTAETVATVLPHQPPGWTWQAIKEALDAALNDAGPGPNGSRLLEILNRGVEDGRWNRSGAGSRGDPFRFWAKSLPD